MNGLVRPWKWNNRLRIKPWVWSLLTPHTSIACQFAASVVNDVPRRFASKLNYKSKRSHYEVLGVKRSASSSDIRGAFLSLSKQCHPDLNRKDPTLHQKFVEVNEAYTVLNKALSRREYDAELDAGRFVDRHMKQSSRSAQSHGYGYSAEPGPEYYHNKDFSYNNNPRPEAGDVGDDSLKKLMLSYVTSLLLALFISGAVLQFILSRDTRESMLKKNWTNAELNKLDMIMSSDQKGERIYYYSVPSDADPDKFDVMAVRKFCINKERDEWEIQELWTRSQ